MSAPFADNCSSADRHFEHTENPNKCAYCGREFEQEVRHHSGVRECGSCWSWRKHQFNEARYWNEAIEHLFVNDLGSGPDMNDYMLWNRWGIQNEVVEALNTLEALRERYEILLNVDDETRREVLHG